MSKHTPGPYSIRGPRRADMADDYAIIAPDGEIIGEAFGRSAVSKFHPSDANAKLFAAAPELLEALQSLFAGQFIDSGATDGSEWGNELAQRLIACRAAIAKATGAA